jgi:hypothetical protein
MNCTQKYKSAVKKYGAKEVNLGIKLEQEHYPGNKCKALGITLVHLGEFPNYNTQLVKFEKRLKKARR